MPNTQAKYKFDRTIGQNLFGRPKSPIFKRNYRPGQHGQSKKRRKVSEFGLKIQESKKVKLFYGGLRHKDLKRVIRESLQKQGNSTENIVKILESRLASVVYRAKFAMTPFGARQLVNHGHVLVNGKKVDIPSYRLKIGDKVSLCDTLKDNPHVLAAVRSNERQHPDYITVRGFDAVYNGANLTSTHYPVEINFTSLLEFFSR